MSDSDATREAWLIRAAGIMLPWVAEATAGLDLPERKMRFSVGWPLRSKAEVTRGQCFSSNSSDDGVVSIFISPIQVDTVTTLAVLLHEMVHAVDDCEHGHTGRFITIARALGFTSKWTTSDNRTDELSERLVALAEQMGDFPSAAIGTGRAADVPKKQGTRQLKAECANGSGYKVRLTQKWIDEVGAPICPCCRVEMEIEEKDL